MLDSYRALLDRLRLDRSAWGEVAFQDGEPGVEDSFDPVYRNRLGVLVCLQYDRRAEEEALLRDLMWEETTARRQDPFQGLTDALQLAAFLLARFRCSGDLLLFWRAKMANFDTFGGFDPEYLFWIGGERALERLCELDPEYGPHDGNIGGGGGPDGEIDLESGWPAKKQEFPDSEVGEDLLRLVIRALALGAPLEGQRWLDRWEAVTPDDAGRAQTLLYWRNELGQPERALEAARRLLVLSGTPRERAHALGHTPRFKRPLRPEPEASDALQDAYRLIAGEPELDYYGQWRALAELLLEFAERAADLALAGEAFRLAQDVMQRIETPLVFLEQAYRASERLDEEEAAAHYRALAAEERERNARMGS